LTTALPATPAEGIVTLLVRIWKSVFRQIAGWFEHIWFGKFSGMAMDSPYISLKISFSDEGEK
jgi:hypothetical protein